MAHSPVEKNFGAEIDLELFDKLEDYISTIPKLKKKQLIMAMGNLWLSLPDNVRANLLYAPQNAVDFVSIVEEIVDRRMDAFYAEDLEQGATLEELEHIDSATKLRHIARKALQNRQQLVKKTQSLTKKMMSDLGDIELKKGRERLNKMRIDKGLHGS